MRQNALSQLASFFSVLFLTVACVASLSRTASAQSAPVVTSISPSSVIYNSGVSQVQIILTGSNFDAYTYCNLVGNGEIQFYDASSTSASFYFPVYLVPGPGVYTLYLNDYLTGLNSNTFTFTLLPPYPVPTLSTVYPSVIALGSTAPLTLTGTNFVSTSTVNFGGGQIASSYVSPTQLTFTLPTLLSGPTGFPASLTPGNYSVSISNPTPGGGTSSAITVTVGNPVPAITSLSAIYSGSLGSQSLTVSGTDFLTNGTSVVDWNGTPLSTTLYSGTLIATVPLALVANPGTAAITVTNPAPAGGTSNPLMLTIQQGDFPTLTSLSPSAIPQGSPDTAVTLTGTNFLPTSTVTLSGYGVSGATYPAHFVSPTELSVTLPAASLAGAASLSLYVLNPSPFNSPSNSESLSITEPVPTLATVTPSSAVAGSGPAAITISGTNFVSQSSIQNYYSNYPSTVVVNGNFVATHYVSPTQLTAIVPANVTATVGIATVAVENGAPGGGTSSSLPFSLTAPTSLHTTVSLSPEYNGLGPGGWYSAPVIAALYAVSPIGIAHTYYTLDGGAQTPYSGSFVVTGDGVHTLQYWSVDSMGTVEPTNTATVKIDTVYPVLTFGTPTPTPNAAGWNDTPVTVPFTVSDALSGLYSVSPATSPVVVATEGSKQNVQVIATDNAGNAAFYLLYGALFQFGPGLFIDLTPPVTTSSVSGTQGAGVYISPVTITLAATDNLSGIATTDYTIDGGSRQTYGGSINLANGSHTLTYWSVDVAGNLETAHSLTIVITRNPTANNDTLALTQDTTAAVPAPGVLANDTDPNNLPLTASLITTAAHGSVTLHADGSYAYTPVAHYVGPDGFTYQASNGTYASNTATVSITVLDTSPPTTTATLSGTMDSGGGYVNGATVTLSATDPDGASDVAATDYILDSGAQQTYSLPFAVTGFGSHTLKYWSVDKIGNVEAVKQTTFAIDHAAPALTAVSPGNAVAGAVALTLTVTGTGFDASSVVTWNGATLVTTYLSATQLSAIVPASLLTAAGTASVAVVNAAPGGGTSGTMPFTIQAIVLSSLILNPSSVTGGASATATLLLNGPALVVTIVTVASNSSAATPSVSHVTIPVGASSATFTVATGPVAASKIALISAVSGGVTKTAVMTVLPPALSTLTLSPTSLKGGASSRGTVTLTGPVAKGTHVTIAFSASPTSVLSAPSSVTIAAGASTATFTVKTKSVSATTTGTVTGTLAGVAKAATLTVTP